MKEMIKKKIEDGKLFLDENKEFLKFVGYSSIGAFIGAGIMNLKYKGFNDGINAMTTATIDAIKANIVEEFMGNREK